MADFDAYSTPSPSLAFSKAFFQRTSIEDIVNLDAYPTIAPENSVQRWEWSKSIPRSKSATTLGNEMIPHANDLAGAYSGMSDAFNRGFRSIRITYVVGGIEHKYIFTFSKLNLIKIINNYDQPRKDFAALLRYLDSPLVEKLGLGSVVNEFRRCSFLEDISGFAITHCPLYKLASLLGEEWVDQDLLDALLEFYYFKTYAKPLPNAHHDPSAPTHIFLPTDFLLDAVQVYHSKGIVGLDTFPAGKLLRCRISNTVVSSIGICRIEENHYTALTFEVGSGALKYGDSMHGEVPIGIMGLISRVLSTSSVYVPPIVERGTINLQGGANGGGGSCSLAALNFIQRLVDKDRSLWRGSQSHQFRFIALLDLIGYTCIARRRAQIGEAFRTHWAHPVCPQVANALGEIETGGSPHEYLGSCYQDFNLYTPTKLHPIFSFLERGAELVPGDVEPERPQVIYPHPQSLRAQAATYFRPQVVVFGPTSSLTTNPKHGFRAQASPGFPGYEPRPVATYPFPCTGRLPDMYMPKSDTEHRG